VADPIYAPSGGYDKNLLLLTVIVQIRNYAHTTTQVQQVSEPFPYHHDTLYIYINDLYIVYILTTCILYIY
jgi:hypothetical protein